jgi:hypothetical protein
LIKSLLFTVDKKLILNSNKQQKVDFNSSLAKAIPFKQGFDFQGRDTGLAQTGLPVKPDKARVAHRLLMDLFSMFS